MELIFVLTIVTFLCCLGLYFFMALFQKNRGYFVVTAHRWGNSENHNYIVGIYSTVSKAEKAAEQEEYSRGIKYECRITHLDVDKGNTNRIIFKKIWDDYPENHFKRFEKEE